MAEYLDLEKLKEAWTNFLEAKVRELKATKNIIQTFHIISGSEEPDVLINIEPQLMDSPKSKNIMGQHIRDEVQRVKAQAVMSICDTYQAAFKDKATEALLSLQMAEQGLSVSQAAALGWCKKREALLSSIESPIMHQMIVQFYRRNSEGGVILMERQVEEGLKSVRANFTGFFESSLSREEMIRIAKESKAQKKKDVE